MATHAIPNHAHCMMCGRAIQHGEKLCGPECEGTHATEAKKRKKMMMIMYGLLIFGMGMLLLPPLFGGGSP